MAGLFKKASEYLLGIKEDEHFDEYEEIEYIDDEPEDDYRGPEIRNISSKRRGSSSGNVRSIGTNVVELRKRTEINICAPKNIEDARDIIENTKSSIISVVNLEGIDSLAAQRIVDFLSGSVYALDGNIRRLSNDMFVIAPSGVEVSSDLADDINDTISESSHGFPWRSAVR